MQGLALVVQRMLAIWKLPSLEMGNLVAKSPCHHSRLYPSLLISWALQAHRWKPILHWGVHAGEEIGPLSPQPTVPLSCCLLLSLLFQDSSLYRLHPLATQEHQEYMDISMWQVSKEWTKAYTLPYNCARHICVVVSWPWRWSLVWADVDQPTNSYVVCAATPSHNYLKPFSC